MHTLLQPESVVSAAEKRRVLIVDDHDFFAACLRTLLDNESDLIVCDVATTSMELSARIERFRPDLLVIDLSLRTESGLALGQHLRELNIMTPILFISTLGRPTNGQLDRVSSASFIAKSKKPVDFLAALRATLAPINTPVAPQQGLLGLTFATVKA